MFHTFPTIDDSFDTHPGNALDADPDYAAPLPDVRTLLAAVGMPAHAIREVLASRIGDGRSAAIRCWASKPSKGRVWP